MVSRATSKQPTSLQSASSAPEHDPFAELDLLKDSLGYAIKCAQVRTYEMLFEMRGPNAITPARLSALSIINTRTGINQSELAAELRITRASVVKVIDTLESLGFVQRQSIEGDRRSYALVVTDLGKNELLGMRQRMDAYELAISARLSTAERAQLMALLAKVAVG